MQILKFYTHKEVLSLLLSSPASVCSLPSNYSNSPPPTNSNWPSPSTLSILSITKRNNSGLSKFKLKASADNGSAEQFLQNNSIADFMRFIKRGGQSSSELQTAVVSYRKKGRELVPLSDPRAAHLFISPGIGFMVLGAFFPYYSKWVSSIASDILQFVNRAEVM